jgi:hypothetical protein
VKIDKEKTPEDDDSKTPKKLEEKAKKIKI